ncbi:MAG: hypothetical protein ACOX05_01635 [Bacillota bacterium]|jgi:hypothetical protein
MKTKTILVCSALMLILIMCWGCTPSGEPDLTENPLKIRELLTKNADWQQIVADS